MLLLRKILVTDGSILISAKTHMETGECRNGAMLPITLFTFIRNVELYFMLIEAFNTLPERSEERYVLMNEGVSSYYPDGGVTYPGFTNDWTRVGGAVTHTYGGYRYPWHMGSI